MSRAIVRGKKKLLTENDFNSIKKIIEMSDYNDTQIGKVVNRSGSTIGYIRRFETFKEYQGHVRNIKRPSQEKNTENAKFNFVSNLAIKDKSMELDLMLKTVDAKLDEILKELKKKRRIF